MSAVFRRRPWGRNECVTNKPHRTSAGRLTFPRIYCCSGLLLLLGQKKKYEAKGLAIQEVENSFRTSLVFVDLGLEEPPLQPMPVPLIDVSSGMAVGRARMPRMATSGTIWNPWGGLSVTKSWWIWFILYNYYFLFPKLCPAGRKGSIHRAMVFPQFLQQRARCGFFILWMLFGSLPG